MRISTNTVYEQGITTIQRQQETLLKTQQQVSTGRRILTPADDPIAAARALDVSQAQSANSQFAVNRNSAKSSLGLEESVLQSLTDLIQNVRETTITAGNPVLSNNDRAALAAELRGRLDQLTGLANSTDGSGQYLFSGYQGNTKPFTLTATGAQYSGDQGQRLIQVGAARQIGISDSGVDIFERIRNGNGVFVAAAGATNAGNGIISPGSVVDPAALTGHSYQINFSVTGGVTTYDVVDTTTSTTLSTGNAYVSGNAIAFDGIGFDIQGSPANGDRFTITPSSNQSLFKTLNDLITIVATPVNDAAGRARLANGLNLALLNLDHALDNVLRVRADVGSRLQEVDALDSLGEDLSLQYQQTLSQLQDVDYARAISDLSRQQAYLEAAQKSFLKVTGMTLFDFI
ncbi:MAG: flagellar hook-associated protein FlgL [Burkholderiales bacterium]|nr:flagellar hook-associated protein FlgL [Burkholderiales bacterium]